MGSSGNGSIAALPNKALNLTGAPRPQVNATTLGRQMGRTLLKGILLTAGASATLMAARVGLSNLRPSASQPVTADKQRRVAVGPTRLRYFEDDNVLTLSAEPARDPDGYYTMV